LAADLCQHASSHLAACIACDLACGIANNNHQQKCGTSRSGVLILQPSSMEQKFLAVGAGKQHRPPGIVDNTLDAPTAALMGEQMLMVQNTL
jgi:hypothetical protein